VAWIAAASGGYYRGGMTKMKTSISLSADLLEELERISDGEPRSALIERVLRAYLRRRSRAWGTTRSSRRRRRLR
jgi:metal-responsive CopG/Arc/MetJ family transcriptional regulator